MFSHDSLLPLGKCLLPASLGHSAHSLTYPGLLLRSPRHPQQALPRNPRHYSIPLLRPPSRLLRRLPARLPRPRKLDPPPLRLQGRLHLGSRPLRHRLPDCLALHSTPLLRRLLRRYIRYWQRPWFARNSCESVHHCLRSSAVC